MATMTRAQMEAVIAGGGSVLHGGKLYTRVEHLPSEAELAQGDPAAEQAAAARLQEEIVRLQEQVARLSAGQAEGGGTAPPKNRGEPKDGGESKAEG